MKGCPSKMYPLYDKVYNHWASTLEFIESFIDLYYGSDNKDLHADKELVAFYKELLSNCGIDAKFYLKKFNLCSLLVHFICSATVWHSHLNGSVSFLYLVHPKFTGLKIYTEDSVGNTAQSFIEYCCVAMCTGWNLMDFRGYNMILKTNGYYDEHQKHNRLCIWKKVLLNDDKRKETEQIFDRYFEVKN